MHENTRQDICSRSDKIDYAFLSLISEKIKVGIIGGGRAGIIKAKYFLSKNCNVSLITKNSYDNNEKIKVLKEYNKFNVECREYTRDFILDKHLIIIAVNSLETRENIKRDCEKLYKIYIDCTNFKEGMAVVPAVREKDNLIVGVNTRGGNPKGSVFIAEKISKDLEKYDGFIAYTTVLRNKFKLKPNLKDEALKFIFSDDFYFFYEKGKSERVIKLFYNEV